MTVDMNLRIAELLSSRICHDLVGPVGAVNNGLELLDEASGDFAREAKSLMEESASQATRRLAFFRFAFGTGGTDENVDADWAKGIAEDFFRGGKISVDWQVSAGVISRVNTKMLFNLTLVAAECLPKGGVIEVAGESPGLDCAFRVSSNGKGAAISDEYQDIFDQSEALEQITARSVPAVLARQYAGQSNKVLKINEKIDDRVEISII